ncbi:MAG: hypothetical protein RID91_01315, partial [Azospirillaceae bacterium]
MGRFSGFDQGAGALVTGGRAAGFAAAFPTGPALLAGVGRATGRPPAASAVAPPRPEPRRAAA